MDIGRFKERDNELQEKMKYIERIRNELNCPKNEYRVNVVLNAVFGDIWDYRLPDEIDFLVKYEGVNNSPEELHYIIDEFETTAKEYFSLNKDDRRVWEERRSGHIFQGKDFQSAYFEKIGYTPKD